ncbi:MAG: ComEC family competence protein, partial [Calditrichaeota bacterium]
MSLLQRQPALTAVLPFAMGMSIATIKIAHVVGWLCLLTLMLISVIGYCLSWQKRFLLASSLAWLFVGFLILRQARQPLPGDEISYFADLPVLVTLEGTICRPVDHQGDKWSAVVSVDSVWIREHRYEASGYCCLKGYDPAVFIDYGDRIVARGFLRSPNEARNPGEFNYRKYLAVEKIHSILTVSSRHDLIVLSRHHGSRLILWGVIPVRKFIIGFIDHEIGGQPGALLKGLLIGAREDLDDYIKNAFAKVGVIHVLAVSGLHVGFIAALLWGFAGFVRLRDPWRTLLVLLGLVFYAHLTGLKPAVVRSVIMAAIVLCAPLLQRKSQILNSLGIAALIILTLNPLQLFEPGFQLSFLAVAGIALFSKRIMDLLQPHFIRWREKGKGIFLSIVTLAVVSTAAQLATLPLTAHYFNRVPLYAMIANLIVIPVVSLIVTLGFSTLIVGALWHSAGAVLANLVWLL